ncbi:EP1-like glycoprotein 2 [Aristolochia californica]|uniref:EP1-like glycoprotein 2 n=1 Tax=Aristolochia californica TaxID=171875 RepID=UPI0035DB9A03
MTIIGLIFCFVVFISFLSTVSRATVPDSETFKYVNEGEFGEYFPEYAASYRLLPVGNYLFQLCFYSSNPDAFHLAMLMGNEDSDFSLLRFVWEANRNVPVGENATLTFGRDGNLVLANPDGRVVWSTGTANKGVVGLKLLHDGNLVLYGKKGKFIWQSFEHPTDTLLVGQSLKVGGPAKLISRVSGFDGSEGPYSLVLQHSGLILYLKVGNQTLSYSGDSFSSTGSPLASATLTCTPETPAAYAYELKLSTPQGGPPAGGYLLARPYFNATLSFMRIDPDGNLRTYTYYDKVEYSSWAVTFTFFAKTERFDSCRLPGMCGSFGVCENEMCVACPQPDGLLGWSRNCQPPKLGSCGGRVDYYKIEGVEHFLSAYNDGEGTMKVAECRDKCSKDCKCLGFTYKQESSKCLMLHVLGTLSRDNDPSHTVYVKIAK